ncbi:hypothetical protein KJ854_00830 [Patescibacteria group bacterium]|nr:hypothetical protein [Patescibacteria group bacterium]
MQTQNLIKQIEKARNSKVIIGITSKPLDKVFKFAIFKSAKTTRPDSI